MQTPADRSPDVRGKDWSDEQEAEEASQEAAEEEEEVRGSKGSPASVATGLGNDIPPRTWM